MARKPTQSPLPKPRLLQRLRADFLTGLVVVLPIFLTLYLLWATIGLIDARVIPLIPEHYNPQNIFGRNVFGFGVLVFLVFTTLVGALTKGFIGRQLLLYVEGLVERTPVVRSIYNGLKQIVERLLSPSSNSFQQACMVEYPRKGLWAVGFVTATAKGELPAKLGEPDLVSVFVPATPPMSGFLLYLPRRDIVVLEMSVEEAAKMVISAGLVVPEPPPTGSGRRVAKFGT